MPPRGLAFVWSPSRCAGAFSAIASCPGAQVPMALSFSFVAYVCLPPGWPLLLFCSCSRAGLFWILRVLAPGLGRGAAVPVGLVGSRCAWWLLLAFVLSLLLAALCCLVCEPPLSLPFGCGRFVWGFAPPAVALLCFVLGSLFCLWRFSPRFSVPFCLVAMIYPSGCAGSRSCWGCWPSLPFVPPVRALSRS